MAFKTIRKSSAPEMVAEQILNLALDLKRDRAIGRLHDDTDALPIGSRW